MQRDFFSPIIQKQKTNYSLLLTEYINKQGAGAVKLSSPEKDTAQCIIVCQVMRN